MRCWRKFEFPCNHSSCIWRHTVLFNNSKKLRVHPEWALGSEINFFRLNFKPHMEAKRVDSVRYRKLYEVWGKVKLSWRFRRVTKFKKMELRHLLLIHNMDFYLCYNLPYRFSSCILFIVYRMQLRGKSLTPGSICCPAPLWRASAEQPAMKKL